MGCLGCYRYFGQSQQKQGFLPVFECANGGCAPVVSATPMHGVGGFVWIDVIAAALSLGGGHAATDRLDDPEPITIEPNRTFMNAKSVSWGFREIGS